MIGLAGAWRAPRRWQSSSGCGHPQIPRSGRGWIRVTRLETDTWCMVALFSGAPFNGTDITDMDKAFWNYQLTIKLRNLQTATMNLRPYLTSKTAVGVVAFCCPPNVLNLPFPLIKRLSALFLPVSQWWRTKASRVDLKSDQRLIEIFSDFHKQDQ